MKHLLDEIMILVGALLVSSGFNLFLIPNQLLSGGISGISMLIGYFSGWNIGILYFVINLPILIAGWLIIGRRFIWLSIESVLLTTWFMQWIPVKGVISDLILGAIFGGVLVGLGTGLSFRWGGSTGGFDIIGSIATRKKDFPLGTLLFLLNATVVMALGYIKDWDLALYSMLSIFVTGKVVDLIHIRHIKVTAFIVTKHKEQLLKDLLKLNRGVTVMKAAGAYSHEEQDMLITVTSRYELIELRRIIRRIDPKAFVNIVETVEVIGEFRR